MISPEDQILIHRSIDGNRTAQGEIYKKYLSAMYHIAVRMVVDKEIARDITQEVFIKVFEELSRFRGESTLGAWIKRITINMSLNHLKKAGKMRTSELIEDQNQIAEEGQSDYPKIEMKVIHEGIKSLPAGGRAVLNLYLLEGYQHKEIADMLGISESTSKTQYRRAKLLLQDKLKHAIEYER